jgi:hypothetical protein
LLFFFWCAFMIACVVFTWCSVNAVMGVPVSTCDVTCKPGGSDKHEWKTRF